MIEYDEKPSVFFCNFEKHNFTSKTIPKLETIDGRTLTDQFEILIESKSFYVDLK